MLVPNPGALGGRKTDELTRGEPVAPKVTDWVAISTPGQGEGLGHSLEHPGDRPPAGKPGERQAPEAEAQVGRRGGRRQDWGAGRVPRAHPQHVPSLGRAKCPRAAPHQALLAQTSFQGAGLLLGQGSRAPSASVQREASVRLSANEGPCSPLANTRLQMACVSPCHTHAHTLTYTHSSSDRTYSPVSEPPCVWTSPLTQT